MLITMHVALLAFYFNMLIYVEIDVCVVPNWSYVMICERRFNLKTTCVKKKYLWLIFYLYIWHKFVLFRLVFVSSFAEPSQLGWTGLLNVGSVSGKLISTYSFFFFKSAMWDYRDKECTRLTRENSVFTAGDFVRAKRSRGSRPSVWDAAHQKCRWVQRWLGKNSAAIFYPRLVFKINPEITFFFFCMTAAILWSDMGVCW